MSLVSPDKSKKVVIVDLKKKTTEVRSFPDLYKYIGGVALGLKLYSLYQEEDPVVLSIGPLNGFYPYASKTSIVLQTGGVPEDLYIGGSLSFRLRFCGIDSLVIKGGASESTFLSMNDTIVEFLDRDTDLNLHGLPGKRSIFAFSDMSQILSKLALDGHFVTPESYLENKFLAKNLLGIVVSGHNNFDIYNKPKYEELYKKLLSSTGKLEVSKELYPSCSGCPMGCSKARVGELGGNILVHSLCACTYSQKIYSDVGTVFSCLHTLGYDYSHEDIENLPNLVNTVLKEIS